jgi:hypothetical protein
MQYLRIDPRGAAAAAVALALVALAAPSEAARGRDLRAEGQVVSVTPSATLGGSGAIILHTRGGDVSFVVTATTQIEVEDETATLDKVLPGDVAVVRYTVSATEFTAVKIEAARPREEIFGVAKGVAKNLTGEVEVTVDPLFGDDKTLKFLAGTEVKFQGRDGTFDLTTFSDTDLAALNGMYVGAVFLQGTDQADKAKFGPARRLPFKGEIVGVDAAATPPTVTVGYQDQAVTFVVVPGSTILRLDGENVDLGALTAGDKCQGLFVMDLNDAGTQVDCVVTQLVARTPRPVGFVGRITGKPAPEAVVTAEGEPATYVGTLEVTLRSGEVIKLEVDSTCKIRVGGKGEASTWADLEVGQKCSGQYRPRPSGKKLLKINARKSGTGAG